MTKLALFKQLLSENSPLEGVNFTPISELGSFRSSKPHPKIPLLYDARIIVMAQGKKTCYIGEKRYEFSGGQYMALFLPMPLDIEMTDVTPEKPALMTGLSIDLNRIARLLLKLDGVLPLSEESEDSSSILVHDLDESLLDSFIRLWRTVSNPAERIVLSESIIEEIYFRLLCRDQTGSLQKLLRQSGPIQQLSKSINHIHYHLNQTIPIEDLAQLAGMSVSGFHKNFKEVMHISPLQYAKLIKLNHAQSLILKGQTVAQTSRLVGYNSTTQFSREYKRHFGYSPSETATKDND